MILGSGVAPSLTPSRLTCLQLHCRQYQHGLEATITPHCCVLTDNLGVPAAVLWWWLMVLPRGTVMLTESLLLIGVSVPQLSWSSVCPLGLLGWKGVVLNPWKALIVGVCFLWIHMSGVDGSMSVSAATPFLLFRSLKMWLRLCLLNRYFGKFTLI